jgi:hypothetical protein
MYGEQTNSVSPPLFLCSPMGVLVCCSRGLFLKFCVLVSALQFTMVRRCSLQMVQSVEPDQSVLGIV